MEKKNKKEVCTWTVLQHNPFNRTELSCGIKIEDNFSGGFKFCPYCGKEIKFISLYKGKK